LRKRAARERLRARAAPHTVFSFDRQGPASSLTPNRRVLAGWTVAHDAFASGSCDLEDSRGRTRTCAGRIDELAPLTRGREGERRIILWARGDAGRRHPQPSVRRLIETGGPLAALYERTASSVGGLTSAEARDRLRRAGPNEPTIHRRGAVVRELFL